jgi:hypothetical protein
MIERLSFSVSLTHKKKGRRKKKKKKSMKERKRNVNFDEFFFVC